VPIKPDPSAPGARRGAAIRHRLHWCLPALWLLAACAQGTPPPAGPGQEARRLLAEQRAAGAVRTVVHGNPFGMDQTRQEALVSEAMAQGVAGLAVRFTTWPDAAAAPEPHLVVALNPGETDPADVLCSAPDRVPTAPAGAELSVLAVFCQGGEVVNAVREAGRVAGPTDRNFERLLWRTAGALFPDDYAETYGFGILPRWLDFGIGGSFGGG
jgi:hypothetical protein